MADIYIRPYDSKRRHPLLIFLLVAVVAALALGGWWWMAERPALERSEKAVVEEPVQNDVPARKTVNINAFTYDQMQRAQAAAAAGRLSEAKKMLETAMAKATDQQLQNEMAVALGDINTRLFFTDRPMFGKIGYVIQPGDSLDRIARRHKTTVDLLRRLNKIEGNLIYPGARIWVPAKPFSVKVDKSDRTLTLMAGQSFFKRYPVGVGRYGKTPAGTFYTSVHQENPDWSPPSGGIIKFGDPRNVLGTRWISFHDPEDPSIKGFGIHGTSERDSIGQDTSNGCIRMLNENVEEVYLFLARGTRVIISE